MKGCRSEETSDCYFHPQQKVVGVCPLCLNEKLIFLASKQGYFSSPRSFSLRSAPASISLPKIFAFTNFLHLLEFRQSKPESSDLDSSTSNDANHVENAGSADSFISIIFEENGVGSWEKNKNPNSSLSQSSSKEKEVAEVGKARVVLRWRKRIDQLYQLIRSRRSSKAIYVPRWQQRWGSQVEKRLDEKSKKVKNKV